MSNSGSAELAVCRTRSQLLTTRTACDLQAFHQHYTHLLLSITRTSQPLPSPLSLAIESIHEDGLFRKLPADLLASRIWLPTFAYQSVVDVF